MAYTLGNRCAKNCCERKIPVQLSSKTWSHVFFWNTVYIGCQLKLECHTNCVLLCKESPTELRHYISSNSVNLAQTRVYVLRHAATVMSPVLTGVLLIVPFLSLPPLFGIVCLAISVAHLLSHLS